MSSSKSSRRPPAGSLATAAALGLIAAGAGATGMIPGTIWLAIAVPTAVTKGLGCGGVRCGLRCLLSARVSPSPPSAASLFPEGAALAAFPPPPPAYAATCSGVTLPESRAAWSLAAS